MNDITREFQNELKKILRRKFRGAMTPTDNVLYFPNNIDVRICPKNGMSTLKWALMYAVDVDISSSNPQSLLIGTKNWRTDQIKKYGYRDELPYRKDSIRVTSCRDPIKRFMSACEYIKTEWVKSAELFNIQDIDKNQEDFERLSDIDMLPDNIDEVIDMVWKGEIMNSHFYTQTYYLGSRSQYDSIFNMEHFTDYLSYIRVRSKTPKKIDRLHTNRTSGLYYGGVDSLTNNQKKLIMRIYEEDYDYGWTED